MDIQRTVTTIIEEDEDLKSTLHAFRAIQQKVSAVCFNQGKPLSALALHHACYHQVKGSLNAQMTCSALRLVAGAYASAKSNKKPAQRPFLFTKACALFLIGRRGRDADVRFDGTLSIWIRAGLKHLSYTIPQDFKPLFKKAKELDSLTVIKRDDKLIGRLTLTLEAPEPAGILPVGIDLNETNALVAVDPDGRELFISGKAIKVKNRRTAKTRKPAPASKENLRPARQRRKIPAVCGVFSNGLVANSATGPAPSPKPLPNSLSSGHPKMLFWSSRICIFPAPKKASFEGERSDDACRCGNAPFSASVSRTRPRNVA